VERAELFCIREQPPNFGQQTCCPVVNDSFGLR
jgi:hypothetical protein